MKAIHNPCAWTDHPGTTVFNISKIQNESNSQQICSISAFVSDCFQYFKDTK